MTKKEKIYEKVFDILSSNYQQVDDGQMGEGEFIMSDEDRDNILNELTAYILELLK